MRKRKFYVVLALHDEVDLYIGNVKLRSIPSTYGDHVGYLPVFKTKRAAKKCAGKQYKIVEIEQSKQGESQ